MVSAMFTPTIRILSFVSIFAIARALGGVTENNYVGIVGGDPVNIQDFPYVVSIQYLGEHICTGVIVDNPYILTTASCLVNKQISDATKLVVEAGATHLNVDGEKFDVKEIIIHKEYETEKDYDIALVRLAERMQFSNKIAIAALDEDAMHFRPKTTFNVTGWEIYKGSDKEVLSFAKVHFVDQDTCKTNNGDVYHVTENAICAGADRRGPCTNDQGSPLLKYGIVVGLASRARQCVSDYYPTIYTRIYPFHKWIFENTVY